MTPPQVEHELHRRRFSRNVGVGVALALLVAIVFGLSVVKVREGNFRALEGYDHQAAQLPPPAPAVQP